MDKLNTILGGDLHQRKIVYYVIILIALLLITYIGFAYGYVYKYDSYGNANGYSHVNPLVWVVIAALWVNSAGLVFWMNRTDYANHLKEIELVRNDREYDGDDATHMVSTRLKANKKVSNSYNKQ